MTSARATLKIEINLTSNWGDECALAQVYKQAENEARQKLMNLSGVKVLDVKIDAVIIPNKS